MRPIYFILVLFLTGCATTKAPPERTMSAEETLGVFFIVSALGANDVPYEALHTVYPLRSQIITFAIIGFHRDRGRWPASQEEVEAYAASSPANPSLPEDAVAGLELKQREDGGLVYTTLEDRQRGREFTISSTHKVSFLVPSFPFASSGSTPAPVARGTAIHFDWSDVVAQAIIRALSMKK